MLIAAAKYRSQVCHGISGARSIAANCGSCNSNLTHPLKVMSAAKRQNAAAHRATTVRPLLIFSASDGRFLVVMLKVRTFFCLFARLKVPGCIAAGRRRLNSCQRPAPIKALKVRSTHPSST